MPTPSSQSNELPTPSGQSNELIRPGRPPSYSSTPSCSIGPSCSIRPKCSIRPQILSNESRDLQQNVTRKLSLICRIVWPTQNQSKITRLISETQKIIITSKIIKTSSDSPPSKNEISPSRETWRNISGDPYCFLCWKLPDTRRTRAGGRVEQSWPYCFFCRRLPNTRHTRARPARRAEVALLFLVREAARHTPYQSLASA